VSIFKSLSKIAQAVKACETEIVISKMAQKIQQVYEDEIKALCEFVYDEPCELDPKNVYFSPKMAKYLDVIFEFIPPEKRVQIDTENKYKLPVSKVYIEKVSK
jgi:hypothetical protein